MKKILIFLSVSLFFAVLGCGDRNFKSLKNITDTYDLESDETQEIPDDSFTIPENPDNEAEEETSESLKWIDFPWDKKQPSDKAWNQYTYNSIESHGQDMINTRPSDIKDFCPNYDNLKNEGKAMFWIGLISAMAKFESSWNPNASFTENFIDSTGTKVISRGLLQLSYESSLGYDCPIKGRKQLYNPEINLHCTVLIISRWVKRDKVLTKKTSGWRGPARYWSVLRKSSTLNPIKSMTKNLEVCK